MRRTLLPYVTAVVAAAVIQSDAGQREALRLIQPVSVPLQSHVIAASHDVRARMLVAHVRPRVLHGPRRRHITQPVGADHLAGAIAAAVTMDVEGNRRCYFG